MVVCGTLVAGGAKMSQLNVSFWALRPLSLLPLVNPDNPKPKIDLKTFICMKRDCFMPNMRSVILKANKLGQNVLS